jgi:carbon-monoxide dehydrogenase small subunit
MRQPLTLTINGIRYDLEVEPHWTLLDVLRRELGLFGTKENCLEAECGVCTVLLDGQAVNACILLALQARGRAVTTIEGLATGDGLDPLQRAFVDLGAVQCGYCTPGMILSAHALLAEGPDPSEDEIRDAIAGNLCRCTGYVNIVRAIRQAAGRKLHHGGTEARRE